MKKTLVATIACQAALNLPETKVYIEKTSERKPWTFLGAASRRYSLILSLSMSP